MEENQSLEQKILLKKEEFKELQQKKEDLEKEITTIENELNTLKQDLKTIFFGDISGLTLTQIEEKKKEINDFLEKHFEKGEELKNSGIIQDIFKEIDEESLN